MLLVAWIEPKVNWTSTDYYNYTDLNRVENNTNEVANFLRSIYYDIPSLTTVTNRDYNSIDLVSSINRVESNIQAIKDNFISIVGYEPRKVWGNGQTFGYKEANRLENNLSLMWKWSKVVKNNQIFCGTFTCGEGVIFNG